jgi:hypothetical protein
MIAAAESKSNISHNDTKHHQSKSSSEHVRVVCGTRHCPACAAIPVPETEDDREWRLTAELVLPRRPEVLDRARRKEMLLGLLDLHKTMRRLPEFATMVRPLLRAMLEGD